ncbi:MAG: hypothetical protein IT580_06505 [Verrucomicrobiales bacterium]|nr:hypothetical protein [Verrucomicrobiales bacterium]
MNSRQPLLVLASLATALFQGGAFANDIEPGKEKYTAIKAPKPIVLDGDLSEWSGAQVLADPRFSVPKGSGDGGNLVFFELFDVGGPGTAVWTGPDDQTSAVQVVYDDDNVYFGFVVTDEYHENAANSAWNGDSVQLMIADAARETKVALYNYALGGTEDALGEIIVNHEEGPGGTEAIVKRNSATKRTTYEIKLPKAALGLETLAGGTQFGLGMAINDGDLDAPGQQGWGGLGAHAIVHGKTPSETALVTLAAVNDIELGKDFYIANAAPRPIVLDGNLGEWSGVPVLSDPKFSTPKGSGRGGSLVLFELFDVGGPGTAVWTGPDDHTSAVQVVYDAENVYFGFVVTDEYHENAANSAWNGDSIQLMIANDKRTEKVALYNYALGGVEDALGEIIVNHEEGPGGTEAVVTRNSATKRTIYEIKLPKASLGIEALGLGTQFGLGMAINDGDLDAPGQQGWGGLGAHSIVHGKTPSETALVTLGTGSASADLAFLSAVNPTINGFSFRANDKGSSVVNASTVKLVIDGQTVTLVASPKNIDATDFTYTRTAPYAPSSDHTYSIELKDTAGNTVTSSGTFKTIYYGILARSAQAATVDTSKRGFIWNVFQNESYTHTSLAETELALAGRLVNAEGTPVTENLADPAAIGPAAANGVKVGNLYKFEIPTVINLSQLAGEANGNFQPDEQMPGIPGVNGLDDGIDAEVITFVELPAGWVKLGVNSDDGFRTQAGYINTPADGILLGEFNGGRGASDTLFDVFVQDAGTYPLRTIYQDGGGGGNIEIFSVKADGTKVLLNDTDNGGLRSFRAGTAPAKPVGELKFSKIQKNANGSITIEWTGAGTLQSATSVSGPWQDVAGASSPYVLTPTAGQTVLFGRLRQ